MKYLNARFNFILAIIPYLILNNEIFGQITKVTLYPYMVTNECGYGDAGMMADEQALAGDPLSNPTNHPTTNWSTPFGKVYPMSAYIDLGSEMNITNIFIYDSNDLGNLILEVGSPGNWQYLLTEPLNGYKVWKRHNVTVNARYLHFVKTSANVNFSEIVIYADNPILPPPNVTNLNPVNATPKSVMLSWTDVPGNQSTGNFSRYDLRYSKTPINNSNFLSASTFPLSLIPSQNSAQQVIITDLDKGTVYYFALKLENENASTALSNIAMYETPVYYNQIETKFILNPEMVVNEKGYGIATNMVDEQTPSGDPLNGTGGTPVTTWDPGYPTSNYPVSAYIDLGSVVYISKVFLRDVNSTGNVTFSTGVPGNWTPIFTDPLTNYLKWNKNDANVFTRYLRVTLASREAKFSEVILYVYSSAIVEQKILLDPAKMNNVSNQGDSWKLVDEQDIAGDPLNSPGGNPTSYWQTGFMSSVVYPLFTELDLGKVYDLSHVFLRDANDYSDFTVWGGNPGNWELLFTDNLTGYLSWNQHDVNFATRYLRFGKSSARSNVSEVVIYGYDRTPGEIDTIPPGKINDLQANNAGNGKIALTWTAPGGDGMNGKISYYIIKYNTEPITEINFLSSTSWNSPPTPLPVGSDQSIIIDGVLPDTRYYFAIKSVDEALNFSPISNLAETLTQVVIGGEPYKFSLTPKMIINESVQGSAFLLVDEQSLSGDPKNGQYGNPVNKWNIGSSAWKYPGYAIIDLGGNCLLTDIYLYDMSDAGRDSTSPVSVFYGSPFDWDLLFVDDLMGNNIWKQHQINQETRYLRIKKHSYETRVAEIVVYGTRLEMPDQEPLPQAHSFPLMDEFIGMNAFVNSPVGRIEATGFVREYHSWMWCEGNNNTSYPGYPGNKNEFNTLGWNFDYFYENMLKTGIVACPAIQKNVPWLTNFNYSKLSNKPISEGEDPYSPASYAEHADHLFQYAARYGNVQVNTGLLKLAANQHVVSGSNYLKYYENWNEQDTWWNGGDANFNPYHYSAMASADYDGHLGTMGQTSGIKNADPNAKLVMGGLAKPDINYIKSMKLWADYYRNGSFPADVINVHHYCNNGTDQTNGNVGISPEAGKFKDLMSEFVEYRNRYYPEKEVWITEFGYDTHPTSVQRAPQIGLFSQYEVQAQWIIRSYLVLAAAGVDKAAMFMLADVNPNSTTKFDNCGLISSMATGYVPKISWYYVYTMKNQLKGMRFEKEIQSGNSSVMVYKFKKDNEDAWAYAIWCPTSNQTSVDGYQLNLEAFETKGKLIELADGSTTGIEIPLNVVNGKVTINVSERPVFVITAGSDYEFPVFKQEVKKILSPEMVTNESTYGVAANMVDEQEFSGDPLMGVEGEPVTCWSPGFGRTYPRSAYIDLGQEYEISKIYLRDMSSSGNITISTGSPDNWTPVFDDDLGRYKVWSGHIVNQTTRYIRVTMFAPTAAFSELILYVRE